MRAGGFLLFIEWGFCCYIVIYSLLWIKFNLEEQVYVWLGTETLKILYTKLACQCQRINFALLLRQRKKGSPKNLQFLLRFEDTISDSNSLTHILK